MNWSTDFIVAGAAIFLTGVLLGVYLLRWKDRLMRNELLQKEQLLLENAKREAQTIIREARLASNEQALQIRTEVEQQIAAQHKELAALQQIFCEREASVNRLAEELASKDQILSESASRCENQLAELARQRTEAAELLKQRRAELSAVSKLNESEVRTAFLKEVERECIRDAAQLSQHIMNEARAKTEEKARLIITSAIQRYAGNQIFEISTSTVSITNEEIKGRIIGREGRNIRAFEAATGVTVLIDDTPGAVVLSGFDPVRREIARTAMERLILDGRIHPARIEEIVSKVSQEIEDLAQHAGEEAVIKVGLAPLPFEISKLLGRLRFRHSYSQNILQHSMEVAHLAGLMAGELGVDVTLAKRTGLLHDIGKAVNHEIEGPHAIVGAEFLKHHGEPEAVWKGVASHHGESSTSGWLGPLVSAADALSASRPGARSETILTYIKRVDDLEKLGASFPGVEKCYALQAGRELRVMVQPLTITDDEAYGLARNMARKIENELQYPGQIRVTIVRETRCIEFAK